MTLSTQSPAHTTHNRQPSRRCCPPHERHRTPTTKICVAASPNHLRCARKCPPFLCICCYKTDTHSDTAFAGFDNDTGMAEPATPPDRLPGSAEGVPLTAGVVCARTVGRTDVVVCQHERNTKPRAQQRRRRRQLRRLSMEQDVNRLCSA